MRFLNDNPDFVYQPEFSSPKTAKIFGLEDELLQLENTNTLIPAKSGLGATRATDSFNSGMMRKETLDSLKSGTSIDSGASLSTDPSLQTPSSSRLNLSEPISGSSISQAADLGFQEQFGNYIDDVGDRLNPFGDSGAGASNFSSAASAGLFNFWL